MDSPAKTRVLLVEDNPADARLLRELLSEVAGTPFAITHAVTLAEATDKLEGQDIVLLDLSLPDAHGLEAIGRVVAAAARTPVIVLTGNTDESAALAAATSGADDYLLKNEVTASLIGRAIWYAIERRRSAEHERHVLALQLASRENQRSVERARLLGDLSASFVADQNVEAIVQTIMRFSTRIADYCSLELAGSGAGPPQRIMSNPSDEAERALAADNALVLPLVARDRRVGELRLGFQTGSAADAERVVIAEEVAFRSAAAIDNALLNQATERALSARNEVLAIVSHDLRNPLSVISLTFHTARELVHSGRPVPVNLLDRGTRAVAAMQRLIDDLLDIARIDAGTLVLHKTRFALEGLLREAIELHAPLAVAKNIALRFDFRAGGHLELEADRGRIAQVIANLLGNAIKFTHEAGTVTLECEYRGGQWLMGVRDNGPGLDASHLPYVFDRSYQTDRRKGGAGLGLAICKGIVEQHGGAVGVESVLGRGAFFWFTLPDDARAP